MNIFFSLLHHHLKALKPEITWPNLLEIREVSGIARIVKQKRKEMTASIAKFYSYGDEKWRPQWQPDFDSAIWKLEMVFTMRGEMGEVDI